MHVAGVGEDQTTNYTGCVVCPLINSVTHLDGTAQKLFLDVCHYTLTIYNTITTFNNLERVGF